MIKHTKLAKSNVPVFGKPKRKKTIKKVVSSCGTPRKIFSKSTSRNGSPFPNKPKTLKKIAVKIPKIKLSTSTPRLNTQRLFSITSPIICPSKPKKTKQKSKRVKTGTTNLSPKTSDRTENIRLSPAETIDSKSKRNKLKSINDSINHLRHMLEQVLMENFAMKSQLLQQSESQEEPKSTLNLNSLEKALDDFKSKLENLKEKFN